MSGKILGIGIVGVALIFGAVMYYMQVFYYYDTVPARNTVVLTTRDGGSYDMAVTNFDGIDADSSPIRFRACFDTMMTPKEADALFETYEGAEPRNAPFWFDCFDADLVGEQVENGTAKVYAGTRNLEFGIDRVVAITDDGRGYIWHEINECGDKAYDGTPLGDDCPARD